MKAVSQWFLNLRKRRKERREEKSWKESLKIKIEKEVVKKISTFMEEVRIIDIQETNIIFKRRSVSLDRIWKKFKYNNILLSTELQHEIKNFIRYKKLKRLN